LRIVDEGGSKANVNLSIEAEGRVSAGSPEASDMKWVHSFGETSCCLCKENK
jgi:hypothetical protein